MNDRYSRVTAPAAFYDHTTRRDYYFKTKNAAREFRLRIKRRLIAQTRYQHGTPQDTSDRNFVPKRDLTR